MTELVIDARKGLFLYVPLLYVFYGKKVGQDKAWQSQVGVYRAMFHSITKKIVEEIDPDGFTLFPVKSPYHSQNCKPLHLAIKKKKKLFSKRENYVPTSVTLTDILIDGQDLDFALHSSIIGSYSFSNSVGAQAGADVGLVKAGASVSGSSSDAMSSVEMRKQTISVVTLLDVAKGRKVNREHLFARNPKNDFHVILDVIETEQECTVNSSLKAGTGIKFLFIADFFVSREKKLTFPAGTSVAYKVAELMITPKDTLGFNRKAPLVDLLSELAKLGADKKPLFINVILEILVRSDSLLVLDEMLDQMCDDLQPDFKVLDQTEEDNRPCVEKILDLLGIKKEVPPGELLDLTPESNGIIQAINILIQSFSEMDPETLILLASSVKAEITTKHLNLVTIIDDKYFDRLRYLRDPLKVEEDPEKVLITELTDEEFEITQLLLDDFGFQLDRESASFLRIKNRKERDVLCLFAALYGLNALRN
ncbi:gasdermin-A2-like [Rhinoraja longicauda]